MSERGPDLPDLAIQGLADCGSGGDVIIPRPGHHNLCIAVTHIAVPHLQGQTNMVLQADCEAVPCHNVSMPLCS